MLIENMLAVMLMLSPADKPAEMAAKIREARAAHPDEALRVELAQGSYEFSEPLRLTPAESGSETAPIVFAGRGNAIFSGGRRLTGWSDDGGGVWSCPAPRDGEGKPIWFNSFYANGRRAECARVPSGGYYMVGEYRRDPGDGVEHFRFPDADLTAFDGMPAEDWRHVVLKRAVKWEHTSNAIRGYDPERREFRVDGRAVSKSLKATDPMRVWFENVRGGFDRAGEWFYDWTAARIRYRPLPGERLETFEGMAPVARLVSVVEIAGDPERERYVTDVTFDGVVVEHSVAAGVDTPDGIVEQRMFQGAIRTGGAVRVRGAKRIAFRDCTVRHTENYAFRLEEGVMHADIVGCEMTDLGAGGVLAGDLVNNALFRPEMRKRSPAGDLANVRPTAVITGFTPLSTAFVTVDDCRINGGGRFNPEGCGVMFTNVSDSRVTHCDIGDMFYTGVSLGFTWGYWGSVAQRNTVDFNFIHDLGKGVMADLGGVYTLGASFGTCVSNNVICNVQSSSYGGWGMYNDEGSEGVVWENNLVYNTSAASYHLHFGRDNVVRNNIMGYQHQDRLIVSASNPKDHGVLFDRNIVIWDERASETPGQVFRFDNVYGGWEPGAVWTNNLFWCTTETWDLGGAHGVYADPKFEAPDLRDFRLRPDSPAPAMGFRPFDPALAGRRMERR